MDNRTDTTEDSQSTPEHLPNQTGAAETKDQTSATPGSLRQEILDSESETHIGNDSAWQRSPSGTSSAASKPQNPIPTTLRKANTVLPILGKQAAMIALAFGIGLLAARRWR